MSESTIPLYVVLPVGSPPPMPVPGVSVIYADVTRLTPPVPIPSAREKSPQNGG